MKFFLTLLPAAFLSTLAASLFVDHPMISGGIDGAVIYGVYSAGSVWGFK